jgi:predicted HTH transcriptional regulator
VREAALKESRGGIFGPTGAAAKLSIPRSTLESKIRSLKIDKNRFGPNQVLCRKDVILARARKNGLKERPVALLGYLLTAGKATVAECEEELKMNRRTLERDLKLLVEKGLVREIGTGPTDPTKYYQPLL